LLPYPVSALRVPGFGFRVPRNDRQKGTFWNLEVGTRNAELKFSNEKLAWLFSFENFYTQIRTHDGAHLAPRASAIGIIEDHILVTLVINSLFLAYQLVGAHLYTQYTSLTPILVNFYCRHEKSDSKFQIPDSKENLSLFFNCNPESDIEDKITI
jgi:hypothetical protein